LLYDPRTYIIRETASHKSTVNDGAGCIDCHLARRLTILEYDCD